MTEKEKQEYLAERKRKTTPPMKVWAPVLTPEQKEAQEKYIKDNKLPF